MRRRGEGGKWAIICCYHLMNGSKYKSTIRTFEPQKQKMIRRSEPGKKYLVLTKKKVYTAFILRFGQPKSVATLICWIPMLDKCWVVCGKVQHLLAEILYIFCKYEYPTNISPNKYWLKNSVVYGGNQYFFAPTFIGFMFWPTFYPTNVVYVVGSFAATANIGQFLSLLSQHFLIWNMFIMLAHHLLAKAIFEKSWHEVAILKN